MYDSLPFNLDRDADWSSLLKANGIYTKQQIVRHTKFNRFGYVDPYNVVGHTREYVFFTRPDLNIYKQRTGAFDNPNYLNPQLSSDIYFIEQVKRYPYNLRALQHNAYDIQMYIPFIPLLTNQIRSTPDLNDITATEMDTASNVFGSTMSYRKDSRQSDEQVSFSCEFEDTKWLEVYNLFKTYDMYERYKSVGLVSAPGSVANNGEIIESIYHKQKSLYDTMGIYKIIVGEDFETILYWAFICGAYPINVPRNAFNDLSTASNITFTVDFKAFLVDDLNPNILVNFNNLVSRYTGSRLNRLNVHDHPIYDSIHGHIDGNWSACPYIVKVNRADCKNAWNAPNDMKYIYKLKWLL